MDRPLRVLHLIDSGGLYGAERVLLTLAGRQRRDGIDARILSVGAPGEPEKPFEAAARAAGLPLECWRLPPGFDPRPARRVLDHGRALGVDVFHSHGYKFDVLLGLVPAPLRPAPLVATLHGYVTEPFPSRRWCYERLDRIALRNCDAVVSVDPTLADRLGLPAAVRRRLTFVPNGIGETPPRPLPGPIDAFVARFETPLAAIGRLSPEKGLDLVLDALASLVGAGVDGGLVLFGDGTERAALEARIRKLGLEARVRFAGYDPAAGAYLHAFRALVLGSRTEGLPVVALEALQAGVPVVATPVGALPWLLDGAERSGFVADRVCSEALTAALRAALDPLESGRRAETGRARFLDGFTAQAMRAGYDRVYAGLARGRTS